MKSNLRAMTQHHSEEIPFANLELEFYGCIFSMTETLEEGKTLFGICAEEKNLSGELTKKDVLQDVFYDQLLVMRIVNELNNNKVSFVHFREVMEDLLVDLIYS